MIIKRSSPVKDILLTVSYFLLGSFLYCGAFILYLLSQSPKLGDELFFNVFHFCGDSYDIKKRKIKLIKFHDPFNVHVIFWNNAKLKEHFSSGFYFISPTLNRDDAISFLGL